MTETSERASMLRQRLRRAIPEPTCELAWKDPWQLLIATILSAQSTDKTVNEVTPALFERYPDPASLAAARPSEVEALVKRTGFFRNKAKAIMGASRQITTEHGGQVPRSMDALCALPGVARKTANLVLGTAFRIPTGIVVDTHARRVAQRLALTDREDPAHVEADLCALFSKRSWIDLGHRLVLHGRYVCQKRAPRCERCPLHELCPSATGEPLGRWTERADREASAVANREAP